MGVALKQSEVFAAYSSLPDVGVALFDARGNVLRANSYFTNMIHVPEDQSSSVNYFDLAVPEDREKEAAEFAKLISGTEQSYIQENRFCLNGSTPGHYDGVFHVMCQVTCYKYNNTSFFLLIADEFKIFRHFRKPQIEP
jgi:PAS domain-containing protein